MILSDLTITREVRDGNIVITPFNEEKLNPNSIDLTLGAIGKVYKKFTYVNDNTPLKSGRIPIVLDVKAHNPTEEIIIPEKGIVIYPGRIHLFPCNEWIAIYGRDICCSVQGKSSLARLGLDIHVCGGHIDTGFRGSLVLEMRVEEPLRIYPNIDICQLKFERVDQPVGTTYDEKKKSKYVDQVGAQESLYHLNFKS